MPDLSSLQILVVALPLIGAVASILLGRSLGPRAHLPAVATLGGSCLAALAILLSLYGSLPKPDAHAAGTHASGGAAIERITTLWNWAAIGDAAGPAPLAERAADPDRPLSFSIPIQLRLDPLTATMLAVVTFVGLLVAVYSIGYMHDDPGYPRFFALVSLFVFAMTMLVSATNFLIIYVFWEAVGACSYLLIGFWFSKPSAAAAAKKAFLVNRVGDFGLAIAAFLIWTTYGTLDFHDTPLPDGGTAVGVLGQSRLQEGASGGIVAGGVGTAVCLLLLLAACGKSAQVPLHVWLPDAMEGPTPASSLIHPATMVAAGVFLIARMFPVFEDIPTAMNVIAYTGAFTAFLGASIAITQNDIKKGLAYSTMSQLGYMVMGMGVGAYSAGLFHLMTHAYFKAMLFLGSGSVIHGMEGVVGHDPVFAQDMRLMGGLRKYMPITAITFLIGTLAISGIPPFAGFWSKDEILGATFAANPALWLVGWLTAGITAFYMFRMYFSTFEGSFRGNNDAIKDQLKNEQLQRLGLAFGPGAMNPKELTAELPQEAHDHEAHEGEHHSHEPHESPLTMALPLVVLAVPSVLVGLAGTPFANYFEEFIHKPGEELVHEAVAAGVPSEFNWTEFLVMGGSSVGIALIGITLASLMYLRHKIDPAAIANKIRPLYELSLNKWYIDDIYNVVFVQGSRRLAKQVLEVDIRIVDGLVNLAGFVTLVTGEGLKYLENGRAQFYALIIFGAVLGLVLVSGIT